MIAGFIFIGAVLIFLGISIHVDRCAKALERIADALERKEAGQ